MKDEKLPKTEGDRPAIRKALVLVKKIAGWGLVLVLALTIIGTLYVSIFQDRIKEYLVSQANDDIQGMVSLDYVSFSMLSNFPQASLELEGFKLFEPTNPGVDSSLNQPILQVEKMIISFDMFALIQGAIIINWMAIEGGEAQLIFDEKGTVNFEKALEEKSSEEEQIAFLKAESGELVLDLASFNASDLTIYFDDAISKMQGTLIINEFSTALSHDALASFADPSLDMEISEINFLDGPAIEDLSILLSGSFTFTHDTRILTTENAQLQISDAIFGLDGTLGLDDFDVNATYEIRNEKLGLLGSIIEEDVLEYSESILKDGRISLNGSIVGKLQGEVPEVKGTLDVSNLVIKDPVSEEQLIANQILGHFNLGTAPDLSDFTAKLETIDINLFEGYLRGSLALKNLQNPDIKVTLDSKFDLAPFNNLFELEDVDSLAGGIEIVGTWNSELVDTSNVLRVKIVDGSANYKALNHPIASLNTSVRLDEKQLILDTISVKLGDNDLRGKLQLDDFLQLIENAHGDVVTKLNLSTNYLDLNDLIPDTLMNNRAISRISDAAVTLDLGLHYAQSAFYSYPHTITWQLNNLDAQLPYPNSTVNAQSVGLIKQSDSVFAIESAKTSVITSRGSVDLSDFTFQEVDSLINSIEGNLITSNLEVDSILYYVLDSVDFGDIRKNQLTSALQFDLKAQQDTWNGNISGNLEYKDPSLDTVTLEDIQLVGKMEWVTTEDNMRTPISYDGSLFLGTLESTLYSENNLSLNSTWMDSTFRLSINSDKKLKSYAELDLTIINPIKNPQMELVYTISEMDLEELIEIEEDEEQIMSGIISFTSQLTSAGRTNEQILQNLNGYLDIHSNQLVIHGINLDEVLKNYGKSQKFRITDLGAYFLAGPFGAVVTKGFDFARIANINPLDSTQITAFNAMWVIDSGQLKAKDVAFVTPQNLVAMQGILDLQEVYIDTATVAVIDKKGCILIDQSVKGTFDSLQFSDFKVGGTLFGAIINVYKVVINEKCDPFYTGSLVHPEAN